MARLRLEYVFVLLLIASNLIIPPLIDSKTNTLPTLPLETRLTLKNNISSGYDEYGSIYEELHYNLKSEARENNTRDYYLVTYSKDFIELSSQKLTGFAFPSIIGGFVILDKIDDTIVISQSNGQGSFFVDDG